MDLRRRLIGSLSLLLASLMGVATLIQFYSLRADIASEVGASSRLVSILLAAENGALTSPGEMAQRLEAAGIGHLSIRAVAQPRPDSTPHPLLVTTYCSLLLRHGLVGNLGLFLPYGSTLCEAMQNFEIG